MKRQSHVGPWTVTGLSVLVLVTVLLGTLSSVDGALARAAVFSSTIDFGDTVSGSIDVPGESDTYTFTASAGDVILIGSGRTSGDVWPQIRLYDPASDLLVSNYGPVYTEISVTLAGAGVHTILVSDGFNGTYTGGYNLYLQRLNGPAAAHPASYGETASGTVDVPVEMEAYTFSASAGDVILIGSGRTSGDVWPKVRLYDPGGSLLVSDYEAVYTEISVTLADAGVHTILVSDGFNGTYTGGYNLYLQRLNGPAAAHPASYGETASGTVDVPVEMEAHTFSAGAGDVILIGSSRGLAYRVYLPLILDSSAPNVAAETRLHGADCVSGDLWPKIRLYDPDGTLLAAEYSPVHTEITHSLSVAGTYSILVSDGFNGTYTGDYTVYLQRLDDPANAIHLSYGQMASGAVGLPGEMDAYTFNAGAGDVVQVSVSRASGNLWPKIRLYDPDGDLLQTEYDPLHAELTATLLSAGAYAILVSDGFDGTYTGAYEAGVQKIP